MHVYTHRHVHTQSRGLMTKQFVKVLLFESVLNMSDLYP